MCGFVCGAAVSGLATRRLTLFLARRLEAENQRAKQLLIWVPWQWAWPRLLLLLLHGLLMGNAGCLPAVSARPGFV